MNAMIRMHFHALLLFAVSPLCVAAEDPLATLNGVPIYQDDLTFDAEHRKLEQQLYSSLTQALDTAIGVRLLEAEANRRELSVSQLLRTEIVPKVGEPTNKEVTDLYDTQKVRINKPLKEVREQLVRALRQAKYRRHLSDFIESLQSEVDLVVHLDPPRLPVDLTDARLRGPDTAPVTIVEFSDFQCPFCRRVQPVLVELQEEYKDQLRWGFKDLPLNDIHPEAARAAQAARCAGEQGKFWPFRAKLFEQELFTDSMYTSVAEELKLNAKKLLACMESGEYAEPVAKDAREARNLGIDGTPAFLINGILLTGARSADSFRLAIDRELGRSQNP